MIDKYISSPGLQEIAERIRKRKEKQQQAIEERKNKFLQLEAFLTDIDSGKILEDIVIYGIRTIKDVSEAEDFLRGYALNIETNSHKYPKKAKDNPLDYARKDIYLALNMHFTSKETHRLWTDAICSYLE